MSGFVRTVICACLLILPATTYASETAPEQAAPVAPLPSTATNPKPEIKATRIGYVDLARIGTESDRGKALKTLLTTKKDALQEMIDGRKKQLEKLKTSIEAKIASMTPKQREAKSKEFQKKLEEFQKFARASEEELFALQEKETKAMYDAIEQAAAAHGKTSGFAVVIVKKELLYIDSTVDAQDVTDALIKAMNQPDQKK